MFLASAFSYLLKPFSKSRELEAHAEALKNLCNNEDAIDEAAICVKLKLITSLLLWGDRNEIEIVETFIREKMHTAFAIAVGCRVYSPRISLCAMQCITLIFAHLNTGEAFFYMLSVVVNYALKINYFPLPPLHIDDVLLNDELIATHVNLLRVCSTLFSRDTAMFFYDVEREHYPLLLHAYNYANAHISDTMVRGAARALIMDISRAQDHELLSRIIGGANPSLLKFVTGLICSSAITNSIATGPHGSPVSVFEDDLAFLSDFLQSCCKPTWAAIARSILRWFVVLTVLRGRPNTTHAHHQMLAFLNMVDNQDLLKKAACILLLKPTASNIAESMIEINAEDCDSSSFYKITSKDIQKCSPILHLKVDDAKTTIATLSLALKVYETVDSHMFKQLAKKCEIPSKCHSTTQIADCSSEQTLEERNQVLSKAFEDSIKSEVRKARAVMLPDSDNEEEVEAALNLDSYDVSNVLLMQEEVTFISPLSVPESKESLEGFQDADATTVSLEEDVLNKIVPYVNRVVENRYAIVEAAEICAILLRLITQIGKIHNYTKANEWPTEFVSSVRKSIKLFDFREALAARGHMEKEAEVAKVNLNMPRGPENSASPRENSESRGKQIYIAQYEVCCVMLRLWNTVVSALPIIDLAQMHHQFSLADIQACLSEILRAT